MLADARSPALLASAPLALVRAGTRAAHVLGTRLLLALPLRHRITTLWPCSFPRQCGFFLSLFCLPFDCLHGPMLWPQIGGHHLLDGTIHRWHRCLRSRCRHFPLLSPRVQVGASTCEENLCRVAAHRSLCHLRGSRFCCKENLSRVAVHRRLPFRRHALHYLWLAVARACSSAPRGSAARRPAGTQDGVLCCGCETGLNSEVEVTLGDSPFPSSLVSRCY